MRGRIRQLKPELFLDDDFWAITQQHADKPLLQAFLGLWCQADREGRFEWKPAMLKTQILPYWAGDFGALLAALRDAGLVLRYEIDGRVYGAIRSFTRHQRPNNREPLSCIPEPLEHAEAVRSSPSLFSAEAPRAPRPPLPTPDSQHPTPTPEVPGLRVVAAASRVVTMPGPEPPKDYLERAVMEGVPREQAARTWRHYYGAGLPQFGVERLHEWLLEQARDYRTRHERAPDNPRASGIRPAPGSDLDTTGAASAFRPTSDHERYASEHRLPLAEAVAQCRGSPRWGRLSTPAQWEEFTVRLQLWRRDGAFPDPNEPLPRPKPKEARA